MTIIEKLLSEIEDYVARAEISEHQFGFRALLDYNFVGEVRRGRAVKVETVEKVRKWMKDNPPKPKLKYCPHCGQKLTKRARLVLNGAVPPEQAAE